MQTIHEIALELLDLYRTAEAERLELIGATDDEKEAFGEEADDYQERIYAEIAREG